MASIRIKKGFDVRLAGPPAPQVEEASASDVVAVYPNEFPGLKPRLVVKEGDAVKRGGVLFVDKQNPQRQFCAPAGGTVRAVVLGERRALSRVLIDVAQNEEAESFPRFKPEQLVSLSRNEILETLLRSGYLAFLRQRPFSKIADPEVTPKSIFVNGMNTAPFQPDLDVVVRGDEAAFQAGLDVLTRLTGGKVHLCLGTPASAASPALTQARNVEIHTFTGPHPAGNTSVHIHHIDPIKPGDIVWATRGTHVILIGKLFLNGTLPTTRVVSVGGPGVKEGARKHRRMRIGGRLNGVLNGSLGDGAQRVIAGDALSGTRIEAESFLRFYDDGLTVVPESRERHLLGWLAPGWNRYSASRHFLSSWFRSRERWNLNTNTNGSRRAMVLTGLYNRFLPMRINVDFLVRAVLAHDTDEAVQLGLLETDPEDFALCAFACPSKLDLVSIMRRGLEEVEEEGF